MGMVIGSRIQLQLRTVRAVEVRVPATYRTGKLLCRCYSIPALRGSRSAGHRAEPWRWRTLLPTTAAEARFCLVLTNLQQAERGWA